MSCYYGPGSEFKGPTNFVPCLSKGNSGKRESGCCALGDTCVGGSACYNFESGNIYQFGCTDVTYQDPSCPLKCAWNIALSPWVALQYCSDVEALADTWACLAPETCDCDWKPTFNVSLHLEKPPCRALGLEARAGLYGPEFLFPYASLPSTLGGSTGYYSPTVVSGTSTWISTAVKGYTPESIAEPLQYVAATNVVLLAPNAGNHASVTTGAARTTSTRLSSPTATVTSSSDLPNLNDPAGNGTSSISTPSLGISAVLGNGLGVGLGGLVCVLIAFGVPCSLIRRKKRQHAKSGNSKALVPHWLAPSTMLAALFAGIFLAAGHHVFYLSLKGETVPQDDLQVLGLSFSKQQANTAAGTALAFLVKACLTLAVSSAYFQALWTTAKSNRSKYPMTISSLDAAFSVLNDFLAFIKLPLWLRNPLLFLLACTAWMIPIASVITPATLSVQAARVIPALTEFVSVPNLDFRSLSFSAIMSGTTYLLSADTHATLYQYMGPSNAVVDVANAVALQSNILPIQAPYSLPNASWNLQFQGPAIRCSNVEGLQESLIIKNITDWLVETNDGVPNCFSAPFYLSWFQPNSPLPITNVSLGTNANAVLYNSPIASNATTYIALLSSALRSDVSTPLDPQLCGVALSGRLNDTRGLIRESETTIVQCDLVESEYNVTFRYVNGVQDVDIKVGPTASIRTEQIVGNVISTGLDDSVSVGEGNNCVTIAAAPDSIAHYDPDCGVNDSILRTLSYQSVFYAFNNLILGSIRNGASLQSAMISNTKVLSTPLIRTREFSFINSDSNGVASGANAQNLQALVALSPDSSIKGLMTYNKMATNASLLDTLERLFQNITISLMSSNDLRVNQSSATSPCQSKVTLERFDNVYVYSEVKLWLAYGLAILVTALAVGFGMFAVYSNEASYTNNFSTVFRLATSAELSVDVAAKDSYGNDPLPGYIGKATVKFREPGND